MPLSLLNHRFFGRFRMVLEESMAEREGFEPPERVNAQRFSRPPLSTTQPPLRLEIARLYRSLAVA